MAQHSFEQSDFEDLSAHLDGQLPADRASAVEELIRTDAAWGDQWNRLQALDGALDAYDTPAPPSDLVDRILLETVGFDDLSAHLDGQLPADRAVAVEELIRSDTAWGKAWNRMQADNADLDAYDVPAPPSDMADRIVASVTRKTHNRKLVFRLWAPLAGAAAAAAIIIVAVVLSTSNAPDPNGSGLVKKTPDAPAAPTVAPKAADAVTQAIVEHLDFVRDLDVLENYETLEAIERLELASTES